MRFYCRCGKRFDTIDHLKEHIKRKHPNVKLKDFIKLCGGNEYERRRTKEHV